MAWSTGKSGHETVLYHGDDVAGLILRAEHAEMIAAAANRFMQGWRQPAVGQRWDTGSTSDYDSVTIADVRADGKYLCRFRRVNDTSAAEGRERGQFTVLTALELNMHWVCQEEDA